MASAGWAWVAEVAGEELAKLEAAHPGRFGPLKAELERLVADPGLDAAAFPSLASLRAAAATDDDGTAPASSQPAPFPEGLICTQGPSSSCLRPHATPRLLSRVIARSSSRGRLHPRSPREVLLEHFCRVLDPEEEAAGRRRRAGAGGGEAEAADGHAAGRDEGQGGVGHRARRALPREDPRHQAGLARRLDSLTESKSCRGG
jgi:hypothetical protein